MQITRKTFSIGLKVLIACLAGIGFWSELNTWGQHAWRLFDTYIMLIASVYYFLSAGFLLFDRQRSANKVILPGLAALLTLNCFLIMVSALSFGLSDTTFPVADGVSGVIICGIVPILVLVDWILYCQKGFLRPIDPLYWLAPPLIYACLVAATASLMPNLAILRLPYEIINYPEIGVDMMLCWGFVILVLMLLAGYFMYCLDFALSGKLAKHIVMPKLKPVVVDLPENNPKLAKAAPAVTLASSAAKIMPAKESGKVPAPKPLVQPSADKKPKSKPPVKQSKDSSKKLVQPETKSNTVPNAKTGPKAITKAAAAAEAGAKANAKTKTAKFHKPASIQNAPSNKQAATKNSNIAKEAKTPVKTPVKTPIKTSIETGKPSHSSEFHVPKATSAEDLQRKEAKDEKKSEQATPKQQPKQSKGHSQKDEFKLPKFSARQDADAPRPSKSLTPVEPVMEEQKKPSSPSHEEAPTTPKPAEKPKPKITKF